MTVPLKNSTHRLEARAVTSKGFGVGDINGFTIFVDGLLTGDVAQVQILKVKKRYGYAKIVHIEKPSPARIKSPCLHSGRCGGCQWQHCQYEKQLEFKKMFVYDAFERLAGIKNPPVMDVVRMDFGDDKTRTAHIQSEKQESQPGEQKTFFDRSYRNKAVFPIVPHKNKNGFAIGMFAARSHNIIEVENCLIQHNAHVAVLEVLKKHMGEFKIPAYDETRHDGLMRFVMVRTAGEEVMVVLVINGSKIPGEAKLVPALGEIGASTVLVNKNKNRGNTILGHEYRILSGKGSITDTIGEISYSVSPSTFFQVNRSQAKKLYDIAIRQAELEKHMTVVDAHVGAGGVLLQAAGHVKKALGIDIVESAVKDARANAELNGIDNTEFVFAAAEDVLPEILAAHKPEVIFLDPPRKGCEAKLLEGIVEAKTKKIIYISCDPATLSRDVKFLREGGYTLIKAEPLDMFPFTGKVETCCQIVRNVV